VAQGVYTPMHVCVVFALVPGNGIDNTSGLLRRCGAIQVRKRTAATSDVIVSLAASTGDRATRPAANACVSIWVARCLSRPRDRR
jgi:hypothetical protein